tara:strand:+ start:4084 stop:4245 length:162 start_codon:yes stop_codon:yes gene_type:complete
MKHCSNCKKLEQKIVELKEEYKDLFNEDEEIRRDYGGLILIVEDFIDKAKDRI